MGKHRDDDGPQNTRDEILRAGIQAAANTLAREHGADALHDAIARQPSHIQRAIMDATSGS